MICYVPRWALIGCGLACWVRRPASRFGLLLTATGFAWFVPEWNNPEVRSDPKTLLKASRQGALRVRHEKNRAGRRHFATALSSSVEGDLK